jgi:hypothetical protein
MRISIMTAKEHVQAIYPLATCYKSVSPDGGHLYAVYTKGIGGKLLGYEGYSGSAASRFAWEQAYDYLKRRNQLWFLGKDESGIPKP